MISITNLQPAAGGTGWTCDATINGQPVEGIRVNNDRLRNYVVLPSAAASVDWADHSITDVEEAVKTAINAVIGWHAL